MKIEAVVDAEKFFSGLKTLAKTFPDAEAIAVNNTAFLVRAAIQANMKEVFDRPTPRTVNSVLVQKADPTAAEIFALIGINDNKTFKQKSTNAVSPAQYLAPEIDGGKRTPKAFENRLQRIIGAKFVTGINKDKKVFVPTRYMELDGFGNPKRSALVKMLSELQVLEAPDGSGYTANRQKGKKKPRGKTGGFFFHPTKPIVMQRLGNKLAVPVLVASEQAKYKPRLKWAEIVEKVYNANIENEIQKALTRAIDKAW